MTDQISRLANLVELSPIKKYLDDPKVMEIYINGCNNIYIRKAGKRWDTEQVESDFADNDAVYAMLSAMLKQFNLSINDKQPLINIRMDDGSRIFAVSYPVSLVGPAITIRKFSQKLLTIENLIKFGTLTSEMAQFIGLCIEGKFNVIISGSVGSGKTTLMNIFTGFVGRNNRIVSIERQVEFQLRQQQVVTLESRSPDVDGQGSVSVKDLVMVSPELRADCIVLGELEGEETLEVLRLADKGQTILALSYANSPQDVLDRLEMLVKLDRPTLPSQYIRSLIGSAINVIVHTDRLEDGSRKITHVSLVYTSGNDCKVQDVFAFQRTGFENGKVLGRFISQPVTLEFYQTMSARGLRLSPDLIPDGAS
jgi:pilus assembly protein CpaF